MDNVYGYFSYIEKRFCSQFKADDTIDFCFRPEFWSSPELKDERLFAVDQYIYQPICEFISWIKNNNPIDIPSVLDNQYRISTGELAEFLGLLSLANKKKLLNTIDAPSSAYDNLEAGILHGDKDALARLIQQVDISDFVKKIGFLKTQLLNLYSDGQLTNTQKITLANDLITIVYRDRLNIPIEYKRPDSYEKALEYVCAAYMWCKHMSDKFASREQEVIENLIRYSPIADLIRQRSKRITTPNSPAKQWIDNIDSASTKGMPSITQNVSQEWISLEELKERYSFRGISSVADPKWRKKHKFPAHQDGKGCALRFSVSEVGRWMSGETK